MLIPMHSATLLIDTFTLGPFETNCYIVHARNHPDCFFIDAGFSPAPLVARVRELALSPLALILTHAHADHIAGVRQLRAAFPDLPIWIHAAEAPWLLDPNLNLSAAIGVPVTAPPADRLLAHLDSLSLLERDFVVLHTPGHSPGGITLHQPDAAVAFVGDTLFAGSVGRTDFPGSDPDTLADSIRRTLYALPPHTRVLPGHGPPTTIEREMRSNPFVRAR